MTPPNFLVIGAPRCGTTFVSRHLSGHPEVYLHHQGGRHSSGDFHFFDVSRDEGRANYAHGLAWYEAHFQSNRCVGEKTADYLADPRAPELIYRDLGRDVKLIALVRDPVERAISHYRYMRYSIPSGVSFMDVFEDHAGEWKDVWLKESGFYFRNLSRYLELFDSSRIHVIDYRDIQQRPEQVLYRLCAFLDIDPAHEFSAVNEAVNRPVDRGIVYCIMRLGGRIQSRLPRTFVALRKTGALKVFEWVIDRAKNAGGRAQARESHEAEPVTPAERRYLEDLYRSDASALVSLVGYDIDRWWFR